MPELRDKYPLTNIYVLNSELYDWAKQKAYDMSYRSVSELIFDLFLLIKENPSVEAKLFQLNLSKQMSKIELPEVLEELEEDISNLLKIAQQEIINSKNNFSEKKS